MNKFREISKSGIYLISVAVVMLSITIKLTLTSGDLLPGLDGAFYWVQIRSLLTNGTMAYEDLPLVFWVQAILAKIVGNIPLAVRLSDAILPTLSVFPLVLLFRAGKIKKTWFSLSLMLMVVLLHPIQLYYFTGDFIKNEAALPLIFLLGWLLTQFNPEKKWRTMLGIFAILTVAAISHFGVLLLGLVITFFWIVAYLRKDSTGQWLLKLGSTVFTVTLLLVILSFLVPDRFDRLMSLFGNLSSVTANPMGLLMSFGVKDVLRPDILFAVVSGQLGSIVLAILVWRSRKELSFNTMTAIVSFLITAFIFSSPAIGIEWALRLTALSFVPLFLAGFVLWSNTSRKSISLATTILTFSTILVSAVAYPVGPTPPVLNQTQLNDFKEMVSTVKLERPSIVVAQHGVDFLTAWYLNTHVAAVDVDISDTSNKYRAHYMLEQRDAYSGSKGLSSGGDIVFENESFTLSRIK